MDFGVVKTIVSGFDPQLNVMVPPAPSALLNATSVQLPGLPFPTTAAAACRADQSATEDTTARARARRVMRLAGVPRTSRRCQQN
jgi:hypothetical protein